MGIQINGNTNNINAGIGSLSIEDINELDIVGIVTASELDISGDIDVDGHTNLDNVSIAGIVTVSGVSNFQSSVYVSDSIHRLGDADTKIRFPAADTVSVETGGSTRLHIHSDGRFRVGTTSQPSGTVGGFQLDMGSYPGSMRLMSGAGASGTESAGFSIGGSNHNANIENGANSGAQVNLYNYNTSDGNSSAVSFLNSNGLSVARVLGLNVSHSSRTGALVFMTSSGSHPTEKLRIASDGRTFINTTAVTNTNDTLTVKRAASGFTEMSMTVDANTATGTHANAFVFTKSKNTYWNGLGFQSSHGHIGAIVGKRDSAGGDADQKIRIEIGGTGINASEEKTWDFMNNGNLNISGGHLKLANGYGIDFSSTANWGTSQNETLGDYEEGGWNPTYTTQGGSAGSVSYSSQQGWYVKIGNTVWVMIDITISSASGMSGNACIGNHPFNSDIRQNQQNYYSGTSNWYIQNHSENKPIFTGWMPSSTNLFRIHNATHWGGVVNAPLNTTGRLSFSHYYTTNSY